MKKIPALILCALSIFILASCKETETLGNAKEPHSAADYVYGADGITKIYEDENGKTLKTEDGFYKTVYEYGENGLLAKCAMYALGEASPFEYYIYKYDGAGLPVKEEYYHTDKLKSYVVYENGEDGKRTKAEFWERTNAFADEFALKRTTVFEYGENGALLREQSHGGDGEAEEIVYEYHENGKKKKASTYFNKRLYSTEEYDENGNVTLFESEKIKTVTEYEDGKMIALHEYNYSPVKSEHHRTFTYAEDGRRLSETDTGIFEGVTTVTEYILRENGRYAEAKRFSKTGKLQMHRIYNANGVNADTETFYHPDGSKDRMVEYNGATVIKITIYNADGTISTAIP